MTIRPRQPKEPPPEEKKAPPPDPEVRELAAAAFTVREALGILVQAVKAARDLGLEIEWGFQEDGETPSVEAIEYVKAY